MGSSSKRVRVLAAAGLALLLSGCPYASEVALLPLESAALDAGLTGVWRCLSSTDDKAFRLTFAPFDEHQYVWSVEAPGEELNLGRAHAGKLHDVRFLSARMLWDEHAGLDDAPPWQLLQYAIVDGDLLRLRFVSDKLLDGAKTMAAARAIIEKNVATAELYEEGWVCVRVPKK